MEPVPLFVMKGDDDMTNHKLKARRRLKPEHRRVSPMLPTDTKFINWHDWIAAEYAACPISGAFS